MQKLRAALALILSASVCGLGVPISAAPALPPTSLQLGVVVFADHAHVGSATASEGSTIFIGDKLTTDATGSLQIRAGAARFLLANAGVATMSSDDAVLSATLLAGTATFSTSNAKAFTLHFANAAIRANTDEPTVGQLSVVNSRELVVKSTRGSVAFSVAGETRVVTEGTAYRVILNPTVAEVAAAAGRPGRDNPQASGPRAGEISRVIPEVNVTRDGKNLSASANFVVDWQDQISTVSNARARVGLDDGSVLNVGSDSLMKVVKHDAGAQQTELDLTYGKLRSSAQKIVKPGGKFEVHTAAGIAGVVGTDFYVDYLNDTMGVVVFAGVVKVCNLAGVCVLVKAGEHTRLRKDDIAGPLPPLPASIDMMTSAASDTEAGGVESAAAAPSAQETGNHKRDKGGARPISSGTNNFVWYAIGVVTIATALALHQAFESPDRP
jgi:ferric-dicitrate binding protein FerR (iron transport regulator)